MRGTGQSERRFGGWLNWKRVSLTDHPTLDIRDEYSCTKWLRGKMV